MTQEERSKKLTRIQANFVKEYPLDFNGTEAYLRASKTTNKKSASVQASKLLKLDKVKDALQVYIEDQLGPHEKRLLENVTFWEKIRDDPSSRVADRMKASENLAKYSQMFVEQRNVNVSGQVKIVDDIK